MSHNIDQSTIVMESHTTFKILCLRETLVINLHKKLIDTKTLEVNINS